MNKTVKNAMKNAVKNAVKDDKNPAKGEKEEAMDAKGEGIKKGVIATMLDEIEKQEAAERVEPTILPELEDLLDTPTETEFAELKKSIEEEGVRDPLIVWKERNVLVDGHNRLKATKLLKKPVPEITYKAFPDIDAVKKWMVRNQLGRRNLTPARFTYYLGTLYNQMKQDPKEQRQATEDGKTTSEKLGDEFGVGERTVRRAGDEAKGIDMIAKVKGRLAKAAQLDGKGDLNKDELSIIGKVDNQTVAAKAIEKIVTAKQAVTTAKKAAKQVQKHVANMPQTYEVAFCEPAFDLGFNISNEPKPPLAKEAAVYMLVPDEHLFDGFKLFEKWGLAYEASIIYYSNETYDGVFSKICHQVLLIGTKGTVMGPKKGKESASVLVTKEPHAAIFKMIGEYTDQKAKRIDMRRNKNQSGWDAPTKA